jgi:hypothetical protein
MTCSDRAEGIEALSANQLCVTVNLVANVRFVPKADILRCGKNSLFDHLVGEQLHLIRDR